MNARDDLQRLVPRLRRYARAVLGDPGLADDCVERALTRVAADPPAPDDVAVGVFAAVHRVLLATPGPGADAAEGSVDLDMLEDEVHALDRLQRHVLLLNGLEGFAAADVARVVGIGADEVDPLLDAAYAALRGAQRGRVLVGRACAELDDALVRAVREAGHEVVGITAEPTALAADAARTAADVVLADLDRGEDVPCRAALAAVRALADVGCVVVTADAEVALHRLADTPVLVVSKPVDARLLSVAFAQALRAGSGAARCA